MTIDLGYLRGMAVHDRTLVSDNGDWALRVHAGWIYHTIHDGKGFATFVPDYVVVDGMAEVIDQVKEIEVNTADPR